VRGISWTPLEGCQVLQQSGPLLTLPSLRLPLQVKLLLQGLRGQGLNDDSSAAEGVEMLVVEVQVRRRSLPP
jgi:hypothetical protein